MTRRLRPALNIVSDIGSLGFDLQHHSDQDIRAAVALMRTANPQMFDWIVRMLDAPTPPLERLAFELGYRCCERGMNLQAALGELERVKKGER